MSFSNWPGSDSQFPLLTGGLFVMAIIWSINGANFMDGADGLLSLQAVIIFVTLYLLTAVTLTDSLGVTIIAVGGASLGFLFVNWEPSKVFLGDVGSYFIGLNMIAAVIFSADGSVSHLLAALILLMPLFTDSTLTLLKRVLSGEKFWRAHSSHVYQMFIRSGCSHALVASVLGVINLIIFAPLAYIAWQNPTQAAEVFSFSCVLSIVLWLIYYSKISKKLNTRD
jgi:Fuc2NAc and GlcNAc transferase